jgi:hypothetical protein
MAYGQCNCLVLEATSRGARLSTVLNYIQTVSKSKFFGIDCREDPASEMYSKAEYLSLITDAVYEEIRAIDDPSTRRALHANVIIVKPKGAERK